MCVCGFVCMCVLCVFVCVYVCVWACVCVCVCVVWCDVVWCGVCVCVRVCVWCSVDYYYYCLSLSPYTFFFSSTICLLFVCCLQVRGSLHKELRKGSRAVSGTAWLASSFLALASADERYEGFQRI
jgi:hypothetical protein